MNIISVEFFVKDDKEENLILTLKPNEFIEKLIPQGYDIRKVKKIKIEFTVPNKQMTPEITILNSPNGLNDCLLFGFGGKCK